MGTFESRKRYFYPYGFYHIYNRGNDKKRIFHKSSDCERFLSTMYRYFNQYTQMLLLAYCLMPNHYHLLVRTSNNPKAISELMHRFMTSYVKYYNREHKHVGRLFQDRFQSKHISDIEGVFKIYEYIRLNPVEAGLVEVAEEYKWLWLGDYCNYQGQLYNLRTTKPVIEKSF
jgi:putative transposase